MNAPPGDEPQTPLIERVLAHLALDRRESGRDALAEDAVWLALRALEGRCDDDLQALLEGDYWSQALPGLAPAESGEEGLRLGRTALGLLLVREGADPAGGSAERTACTLAALALGCADPDVGRGLQAALATIRLLDVTRQIPVATHVRQLAFEFRHLDLRPPPTDYMARIEDALERFDAEQLLPTVLADRRPHDPLSVHLQALAQTRSPTLLSLARVLLAHARFPDGASTLAACRRDAPATWRDPGALARLERAYGQLRGLLADTPYALCPRGEGYGVARAARAPEAPPDA
ncbi:MAG: hypothetical protein KDD82_24795 [Planctomycetes bacterium]|nr:hypothetical protein [Planctomycetota bacterium]